MPPTGRLLLIVFLSLATGGGALAQAPAEPAVARSQEGSAALAKGSLSAAVAAFTEALKEQSLTNDRKATILNDRGVAYGRIGQPRLAVEDFNRAVQLFPEYAAVYNNRGNTLVAMGQVREALKDFDRAIVLTPGYAVAFHNRASAYIRLGQTAQAIRDYTKAIELMPGSAPPLSGRGRAFLAEGRPYAAMRDFSRAILSDARFSTAYRSRAEAKIEVERIDDAIEDLSRAIAFEPGNAEVFVLRAQAYLANHNPASAIKDFTRAIELDAKSVAAFQGRGLAHAKVEAFEEAEADLARAIELDPRAASAFAYRAYVYKLTAQPELGLKETEKAFKIDLNKAEAYWAKGEIEEALGRTDEAVASLRRALVLKPGLKDAAEGLARLGAPPDDTADSEVVGAGIARWRVVARSGRYFAVSEEFRGVRVPLEMMGEGIPRLLEWEVRKPPLQGFGSLKFSAGRSGALQIEQVAIVDTQSATVVGVQLHRVGDRVSQWTWDDGRVTIASIDGVTDEFVLKAAKPIEKEVPVAAAPQPRRVSSSQEGSSKGTPSWAPWAQSGWGGGGGSQRQQRQGPKPKTLFDLLLGN